MTLYLCKWIFGKIIEMTFGQILENGLLGKVTIKFIFFALYIHEQNNRALFLFFFYRLNISFIVDTDIVKGFRIPAQASLSWPSFSSDKPVKFPLTHLGNSSTKFIMLENPADVPVVAQIVPFSIYPQALWDLLADR